jgi:hypothetical protein
LGNFPVAPDPKLSPSRSYSEQEQTLTVSHVLAHTYWRKSPDAKPKPINVLLAVLIHLSQRLPGVVLMAISKLFHEKFLAIASTPSDFPHIEQTLNLVRSASSKRSASSPSITTGGGGGRSLPSSESLWNGFRKDTRNTGWTRMLAGSSSLQATVPTLSTTGNGPNQLGINFLAPAGAFSSFVFLELNRT